jgi:hypothetical protein
MTQGLLSDGHIQARIDSNIRITSNTTNRAAQEQSSSQFDSRIAPGRLVTATSRRASRVTSE